MIIVIHGDDITQLTKRLDDFLQKNWTVRIDAKKTTVEEIEKNFRTDSLFDESRTIIVENIKTASKGTLDRIVALSNASSLSTKVVIYNTVPLDLRIIKKFKTDTVFEYKLPKLYFQFLDYINPGNALNAHKTLQKLSSSYTSEQLFYSLVKRVRQLLMLKTGDYHGFEELAKMGDWQIGKLKKQAALWEREDLVRVYRKLFELEKGMKTSALPAPLLSHLDILLASEL